jgi:hypothetical protein
MKSTGTTGYGRTGEISGEQIGAIWDATAMTSTDIATAIQRLSSILEARKTLNREMTRKACRDLHRQTSFVAHIERFAL